MNYQFISDRVPTFYVDMNLYLIVHYGSMNEEVSIMITCYNLGFRFIINLGFT